LALAWKFGHARKTRASVVRVLTFTSLFPNASQPLLGIFVAHRVAALARRPGITVEVVAPVPYFPRCVPWSPRHFFALIPRKEKFGNLTVHHPRYLLLPKVSMFLHGWLMYFGSLPVARRLHRTAAFDCIDAHYVYPDGFAAALLGKLLKIPVITSARGTDINLFPSFRSVRPQVCRTLERAAGIVAVSAALKEEMKKLGVPDAKIEVIPNGIDTEEFHRMDRKQARRYLGLPEDGLMLLSVGGLAHHKGFHLLIAAVAELAPRHPDLKLYIVGDGAYRADLETLIRDRGIEQRIVLAGSQPNEQLVYWYNSVDITCLASLREGMPNVLLESLACGTPVVATRVGGVPEVVHSAEMGVLVDPDPRSIVEGFERALRTRWDREALAHKAGKRTWDVVAAEVEDYLASSVAASARRTESKMR
jgi:glycosyltransferase involved in cell wall biosynthesis